MPRLFALRNRRGDAQWASPLAFFPSSRGVLVSFLILIAPTSVAHATSLQRLSLDNIVRESGRIVHATVIAVRSARDESGLPATWITLTVERTIKGPHATEVTFKQFGVAEPLPDGTITNPIGLPRYRIGDEVVLFLRQESRRGFTSPVGFNQGTFRVNRQNGSAKVRNGLEPGKSAGLDEFLTEVNRLAHQTR